MGRVSGEEKKMISIPAKSTDSPVEVATITISIATYPDDVDSVEEAMEWEEYFTTPDRWVGSDDDDQSSNSDSSSTSIDKENEEMRSRSENPKVLSEQIRKSHLFIDPSSSPSSTSSSTSSSSSSGGSSFKGKEKGKKEEREGSSGSHSGGGSSSWVPKVKSKLLSAVSHSRTGQHNSSSSSSSSSSNKTNNTTNISDDHPIYELFTPEIGSETIFENQRADMSEESTELYSPNSSPRDDHLLPFPLPLSSSSPHSSSDPFAYDDHHHHHHLDHHSMELSTLSSRREEEGISIILKVSKKRGRRFEEVAKRAGGKLRNYIPVKSTGDVHDVITSIFNKYDSQRIDKMIGYSENDCLKIVLAGNDPFVNDVLKVFVEQMSKKSRAWCVDRVRFYLIPIGINIDLSRHIASIDSTYRSLFFSPEWDLFFDNNDPPSPDLVRDIEGRVEKYIKEASDIYRFELAEAFITQVINADPSPPSSSSSSSSSSSQPSIPPQHPITQPHTLIQHTIKVPFLKSIQIGSINIPALTEEQKEKKKGGSSSSSSSNNNNNNNNASSFSSSSSDDNPKKGKSSSSSSFSSSSSSSSQSKRITIIDTNTDQHQYQHQSSSSSNNPSSLSMDDHKRDDQSADLLPLLSSSPLSSSNLPSSGDSSSLFSSSSSPSTNNPSAASSSSSSSSPSSSSSSSSSSETELQLDYWVPKKKGGDNKDNKENTRDNQVSIKGYFGFVGITRFKGICTTWKIDPSLRPTPSSFAMMLQFKDKKRGFKATVAKAGINRHTNEGKLQSIPSKITKVTCSTPSPDSPFKGSLSSSPPPPLPPCNYYLSLFLIFFYFS